MIGIVVVSHSPALARAACDLALVIANGPKPAVEIAAGDSAGGFGTSARSIVEAIRRVASDDGVLVLVDLGSAILNAEMALDLLGPTEFEVRISAASFVEGLLAASATAAAGASLAEVDAEACRAGAVKADHLGTVASRAPKWADWDPATTCVGTARLVGEHGLHARPSARLVETVSKLDAQVRVRNSSTASRFVDASSISGLMALGAAAGDVVTVEACGNDASNAVAVVTGLLTNGANPAPFSASNEPVGVSPGVAVGIARRWHRGRPDWLDVPYFAVDPTTELDRLSRARSAVHLELAMLRDRVARSVGMTDASILDSWSRLIDDRALLDPIERRVQEGEPALRSWLSELSELIARISGLSDPYLRQRATDIGDIRDRVAAELAGAQTVADPTATGIVVAEELSVAEVARLDPSVCLGIVTSFGSATSHASILARSLGIPAVLGVSPERIDSMLDRTILIDGSTGEIVAEPSGDQVQAFIARHRDSRRNDALETKGPAITSDGVRVNVAVNIGSAHEAALAIETDADGVGLLRTEFMFANWREAPSEEQQYQGYAEVAKQLDGRTLTIRTFDGASDKPLWFLGGGLSTGPRGLMLSLAYPEVLVDQLRAIARVAAEWPIRLLLPYVLNASDVREAKALLLLAAEGTGAPRGALPEGLAVGAMIERPGAALDIAAIAAEVDFLSIGTNDLAAVISGFDRARADDIGARSPLDPAVLRLVRLVAEERPEMSVSVCGELANELDAVPILIGLGVDQLSVRPARVAAVKQEVRRWSSHEARAIAGQALELGDGDQVAALVRAHRRIVTQATGNGSCNEEIHQ